MAETPAYICYVDDSGNQDRRIFTGLITPLLDWRTTFALVKDFRKTLKDTYGIYLKKELHATEFVRGKGRIADRVVPKYQRRYVFNMTLDFVAKLPNTLLINACDDRKLEERLYERFLQRIHNTMAAKKSKTIIISDEGKDYTTLLRKMGVYNPVMSQFGNWPDGSQKKQILIENIVEDLLFRESRKSYFIQLADFCAYALYCSEVKLPVHTKHELHLSFDRLRPICTPFCFRKDPRGLGIIRAT